jgi:hypothetical protein
MLHTGFHLLRYLLLVNTRSSEKNFLLGTTFLQMGTLVATIKLEAT